MHRAGLSLLAVAGLSLVAIQAFAASTRVPQFPYLVLTTGLSLAPEPLPDRTFAPARAGVFAKVRTADGAHPSALREWTFDVDDLKVNTTGYPVCEGGRFDVRRDPARLRRVCRAAMIGSGRARFEVAFPEREPIVVTSPVTVLNGGTRDSKTKLLIHAFVTVPAPAAIVTDVTIERKGSGIEAVARIPVIAGGSGSLLDLRFRLGRKFAYEGKRRSLLTARCPDGKFELSTSKAVLRNEANTPGVAPRTILKGRTLVPCRPAR